MMLTLEALARNPAAESEVEFLACWPGPALVLSQLKPNARAEAPTKKFDATATAAIDCTPMAPITLADPRTSPASSTAAPRRDTPLSRDAGQSIVFPFMKSGLGSFENMVTIGRGPDN